ncbi:MAG: hypothetical protein IT385_01215, partial [Deltaproteobacteria bacterium]|nr:hypothetical protein [Deltaproteobacteria bacterium]
MRRSSALLVIVALAACHENESSLTNTGAAEAEVVEPAPEVVEPAPEVVEPAPEVVEPAPEVVEPAPEV